MILDVPFSTKPVSQTVPGELVIFQNTGDVGFVISALPDGRLHVGILRSTDERATHPHWTTYPPTADCVSYGTDWIFEIVAPPSDGPFLSGNARYAHGNCLISGDDVLIQLGKDPSSIMTSESYVSLRTFTGTYHLDDQSAVAVGRWQVWLSARERDSDNRTPFLRHGF